MAEIVLEVKNLSKYFKVKGELFKAVDDISFQLEKGKIYGFVGKNGSGKTTTIKMLLGLVRPTAGEISIKGNKPGSIEANSIIGYVPEKPVLYPNMLFLDYIGLVAEIYGLDVEKAKEKALQYAKWFELESGLDKKIGKFSSGMKQKLLIIQALLHDPEILILDEPTTGLDPTGQDQLLKLLKGLAITKGTTVLMSSHHLGELERIADEIIVINKGKLVLISSVESLKTGGKLSLELITNNPSKAENIIREVLKIADVKIEENKVVIYHPQIENLRKSIVQALINYGIEIISFGIKKEDLWGSIVKMLEEK
ncbi:MAG: ABC transporter ATP-binding protein [Candidatus Pacearchaeota archaeon]